MEQDTQSKEEKWSWLNHKPDNMITIVGSPEKNFFKWWCTIINPLLYKVLQVTLTPKEMDLIASFLKLRHELSKKILDPIIVDSQLMTNDSRDMIIQDCGISLSYFYVLHSNLKGKGLITDTGINPILVPRISKDNNGYCQLLFLFKDDIIKLPMKKWYQESLIQLVLAKH
jgi:hypothetical protein